VSSVDIQIIARQYNLSKPLYARRRELCRKIQNFWPVALEQCPPEIDQHIVPSDSEVMASALKDIHMERFEVPDSIPDKSENPADYGQPRSVKLTFEFSENEWFTDSTITKNFWYRRNQSGYTGLVSDPVKINWKKGKDLTKGLLDASCKLFEAQKKSKDTEVSKLPEYQQLKKRIEKSAAQSPSFFAFFGYRGPWISAEESTEASKKFREKLLNPEGAMEDTAAEDEINTDYEDVEIFPDGDTLATVFAEDFYTSAIRYFITAQESELMSDEDFEDEEDDLDDGEDDDDAVPDLVGIVKGDSVKRENKEKGEGQPPAKKRKN
jgi:hypothetical protein